MRVWRSLGLALALLSVFSPLSAMGATLSGRASTVLEWSSDTEEDTVIGAYQYLQLSARELAGGASLQLYGRLADELQGDDDLDSRLYYAYVDKDGIFNRLDLRLGRQFITTAAGASMLDGLRLDYRIAAPFSLRVYGGGDVSYYDDYEEEDSLAGIEGNLTLKNFEASISYLQKRDAGDLSYELAGLDLDYQVSPELNLYSETQYSLLTESVTYFLAGGNLHAGARLSLRGEYLYSLPVFSSTSIYSVFAASEYQEASLEATYQLRKGLVAFARLAHEFYDEFEDATTYEAGVEKYRTGKCSGYLIGTYRDDEEGQDLYGLKARAAYRFVEKFEAGIGAHIDVMERRIEEEDETTSSRVWADATAYLNGSISLQAKAERVESSLWSEYYRGRVRLDVRF